MSHNVSQLDIKDLHATIDGKEILKGVDFQVKQGEIHAVMGPNGSGKSTLASTVMGHPKYIVTKGDILFDNESILKLAPDVRARKGLFLAFQYPYEVPGVSLATFLRTAYNAVRQGGKKGGLGQEVLSVLEFRKLLKEKLKLLDMDESFATRYLNEGFSEAEKEALSLKRSIGTMRIETDWHTHNRSSSNIGPRLPEAGQRPEPRPPRPRKSGKLRRLPVRPQTRQNRRCRRYGTQERSQQC